MGSHSRDTRSNYYKQSQKVFNIPDRLISIQKEGAVLFNGFT